MHRKGALQAPHLVSHEARHTRQACAPQQIGVEAREKSSVFSGHNHLPILAPPLDNPRTRATYHLLLLLSDGTGQRALAAVASRLPPPFISPATHPLTFGVAPAPICESRRRERTSAPPRTERVFRKPVFGPPGAMAPKSRNNRPKARGVSSVLLGARRIPQLPAAQKKTRGALRLPVGLSTASRDLRNSGKLERDRLRSERDRLARGLSRNISSTARLKHTKRQRDRFLENKRPHINFKHVRHT